MISIVKGDDRNLNLFFILTGTQRPYDLTGWTHISVFFKMQYGDLLEKSTTAYNTFATAFYSGITFTALASGTAGNSIALVYSGTNTVQQVVNAWNTANPSNKVSHNSPDGNLVIPAGTVTLADALDNLVDVTVVNAILGHVKVHIRQEDTTQLLAGRSLSFKAVIDNGAPPNGERRKIIFENALEVTEDIV